MNSLTALIILTYNNADDTRNCIKSVIDHNSAPVRFVVVDNSSRPDERQRLMEDMRRLFPKPGELQVAREGDTTPAELPQASLLLLDENRGYARGNNAGLLLAYADPRVTHVMILNNDILFVEDIIPRLIERYTSLPDAAIVSPLLYKKGLKEPDYNCARRTAKVRELVRDNFLHYYYRLRGRHAAVDKGRFPLRDKPLAELPATLPVDLLSGSCMLVSKQLFSDIGSFDPGTFLYYEEDILHAKTRARGLQNYLLTDLRCIHLGASTTTQLPRNGFLLRTAAKSRAHYVNNFSGASRPMKILYALSDTFYRATISLSSALKRGK